MAIPGKPQAQMTQWYQPPNPMTPGAIAGTQPPTPWVRSVLDARRMMLNRTPESEFPSGYLGTIQVRNSDKVLDSLQARTNQRSYQRGVHRGERIDPGDYLDPPELDPLRGLRRQATTGLRNAPLLEWWQPTPVVEGRLSPRASESILTIDEHRQSNLAMLAPKWSLAHPRRRMEVQT
jgi:hypothetical protein